MTTTADDTTARRLIPSKTALLVIDMQNDFCAADGYVAAVVGRDTTPCRAVVEPIARLADAARNAEVSVIWLRADYTPEKLPPGMRAKFFQRGDAACCVPGTTGYDFFDLAPQSGDAVFDKHSYSGFSGTELEAHLRERGISTLVFAGVQTNVCVETTFRDAVCIGFSGVLAVDCVASHAPPLHDAAIANIGFLFGDVLTGDEIARHWRST